MEKLTRKRKTRKPLPFETAQLLYGVSVLLTFLLSARLGAIA